MSKFAATAPASKKAAKPVKNMAGGKAFAQDLKTELVSHFLTSMVSDQYYRSESSGIKRVQELMAALVERGEAKFVAQAALVARTQFHLRSISHLAAGLLGQYGHASAWRRPFYKKIVLRADDVTEIVSVWRSISSKSLPNAMKRGLGDALAECDEYQLAKYRGGSGKLKLIDAVNLCHPKATPAIKKLMEGTLGSADTWEVGLSAAGDDAEKKGDVWRDLLAENKLGYMAALRNLRNISQQAPDQLDAVLALLTDPKRVAKSRQLPFRFWSAMKVANSENLDSKIIVALDKALSLACGNVPNLPGKTLVAVDFSGSMNSLIAGEKSTMQCREVATLLALVLAQSNDSDFIYFGDTAKYHKLHPTDSIMGQMQTISQFNPNYYTAYRSDTSGHNVGHGTNFGSVFHTAKGAYDRILFFTDGQSWGHSGTERSEYCRRIDGDPYTYVVDLRGLGTTVFNPGNSRVFQLAGFSDKIFDLIGAAEVGVNALIENVARTEI